MTGKTSRLSREKREDCFAIISIFDEGHYISNTAHKTEKSIIRSFSCMLGFWRQGTRRQRKEGKRTERKKHPARAFPLRSRDDVERQHTHAEEMTLSFTHQLMSTSLLLLLLFVFLFSSRMSDDEVNWNSLRTNEMWLGWAFLSSSSSRRSNRIRSLSPRHERTGFIILNHDQKQTRRHDRYYIGYLRSSASRQVTLFSLNIEQRFKGELSRCFGMFWAVVLHGIGCFLPWNLLFHSYEVNAVRVNRPRRTFSRFLVFHLLQISRRRFRFVSSTFSQFLRVGCSTSCAGFQWNRSFHRFPVSRSRRKENWSPLTFV